ncbi:MAG: hypothetical protein U1F77_00200 [Kiritimatiellia bacterium]
MDSALAIRRRFARDLVQRDTGEPLLNELPHAAPDPAAGGCIRVELYGILLQLPTLAW